MDAAVQPRVLCVSHGQVSLHDRPCDLGEKRSRKPGRVLSGERDGYDPTSRSRLVRLSVGRVLGRSSGAAGAIDAPRFQTGLPGRDCSHELVLKVRAA